MSRQLRAILWDGDNTLWQGTLAEGDTPVLPSGRLELCKQLCEWGVLQSVLSHNHPEDVNKALDFLKLTSYFVGNQCGLNTPKPVLVEKWLDSMDISSTDGCLFIDDNPANLFELQTITSMEGLLAHDAQIDHSYLRERCRPPGLTAEAANRVAWYKANLKRKGEEKEYPGNREEFLRSCGMWAKIRLAREEDMVRVLELVSRAHRMAAAALDFDNVALFQVMEDDGLYVMECGDRFGDYGLSGVAMCTRYGLISLLVISCRLRGKGYGSAMVAYLVQKHGGTMRCLWRETEYNREVRALFEWFGFRLRTFEDMVTGAVEGSEAKGPDWIRVEVE